MSKRPPSAPFFRRYARFWREEPQRDVDDELAFHIEMRVEEMRRAGMTEAQAREATMQRFGSFATVREECEELSHEREGMKRRADQVHTARRPVRLANVRRQPRLHVRCRADHGHRHRGEHRGVQRCLRCAAQASSVSGCLTAR